MIPSRDLAERFVDKKKDVYIEDQKYYKLSEIHTLCKEYGILKIVIYDKKGEQEIDIENYKYALTKYYNSQTKLAIALIKENKDIDYLADFRNGKFLVPIKIDSRIEKQMPKIHYACAVKPDANKKMCLAFTDFIEFQKWSEKIDDSWELIQVNFRNLNRIRKGYPVLIDPLGNRLTLTSNMFREIKQK